MSLIGKLLHFYMERSAAKSSLDELQTRLQLAGVRLVSRMEKGADTPADRERARHVIGMERWSQHRLRSLLGEPLVMDEYDGYRPQPDLPLITLGGEFSAARVQTLALIQELRKAGGVEGKTVPHNDMGDLSVRGWLVYLNAHSTRELQGIR
jgi:hypothetical protein